jgi:hypothetical protein
MNITKLTNEDIERMNIAEVFQVLNEVKLRSIPDPEDVGAGKVIAEAMFQKSLLHILEKRFHYLMENSYISGADIVYYILRLNNVDGSIFFNRKKVFISDINIKRIFQNYEELSKLLDILDYEISFYSNYPYSDEILLPTDYKDYRIFEKYTPTLEITNKLIMEKIIIYFLLRKISNSPNVFVSIDKDIAFLKLYGIYKYNSKFSLQLISKLFKYTIVTRDNIFTPEGSIVSDYYYFDDYFNNL